MEATGISEIRLRVNYSEIDQMGVVYHARYLVWLDVARTEHLRATRLSYAGLERQGLRLAVGEARIRYRQPARYDDPIRVRCWVRERASRRVTFGYAVDHADDGRLLATAETALLVLDDGFQWARLPPAVAGALVVTPDPVRLF
jgi:acyl-CoA thioester hydrolase